MIDNWQNVDWQAELDVYLEKLANPATSPGQCRALRVFTGRVILLMQEYLEPQDYEYILQACLMSRYIAAKYREAYTSAVQTRLDEPHHYNCRCELPYDEQEDRP